LILRTWSNLICCCQKLRSGRIQTFLNHTILLDLAFKQYIASQWQPLCDLSSARERRVRKGDCGGDVVPEGLLHATRTSAQLPRGTAVAGENDAVGCQQTPVA